MMHRWTTGCPLADEKSQIYQALSKKQIPFVRVELKAGAVFTLKLNKMKYIM